jgi:hypothetical protein
MNFYDFVSVLSANKSPMSLQESTNSFGVAPERREPYIEPTLDKTEFERAQPAVILVSAVGATGKTTLAQVLSHRTKLPLLDLAKHKPVGDNTLTGLLTSAFRVEDLSTVFDGIRHGKFGVIIDGIDEGRSKTSEKAFEAFLDDVSRLCKDASTTSFVLLGRTRPRVAVGPGRTTRLSPNNPELSSHNFSTVCDEHDCGRCPQNALKIG